MRFVRLKNIIGPKIRTARNNARMSQAKLAARLQVLGIRIDRSSIAKIETGRRPVSDIEFADSKAWFQEQAVDDYPDR